MKKSINKILKSELGPRILTSNSFYPFLFSLFFIVTLVIPYCNSFGYDNDTPGKWWKNNEIVKSLELSNAQVDQIEKIFSSRKDKIKELGSNLRKKEKELDNTIRNPNSSNEEVLKLSNEVEEIRGNLRKVKVNMFLQIREVLTPQQRGKLQEIRPKRGKPFH